MDTEPNLASLVAQETSRLRRETMRVIGLSRADRETTDRLSPWMPPAANYQISPYGNAPGSWVIERITPDGGRAEQLILFDTLAEAERVLDHFGLRGN